MPSWSQFLPWNLITEYAGRSKTDPLLIAAIMWEESKGFGWKCRYEKDWKYLVRPGYYAKALGTTEATEVVLQMLSWGPMQIMGSVAREIGFEDDLTTLARPTTGIKWACEKLKRLTDAYGRAQVTDIAAAWNGGPGAKLADGSYKNQKYVDAVMRSYVDLKSP